LFRLSKLTDYGIVLLAHLARDSEGPIHNARELADDADLPLPVVSKVLKVMTRHGVLESQRGAKGGYALARPPHEITVAEMIGALEGPVALTECAAAELLCPHEGNCTVRGPWQLINGVVHDSLTRITLADLIDPTFRAPLSPLEMLNREGAIHPVTPVASPRLPEHRRSSE
jgi:FeS assembly SUF system regulator